MAVDNVGVNPGTGVDGNSYTQSISNDTLTNKDFLNLMITELKLQDPTKPMDSQKMLDTQMQMSSIQTNIKTAETMDKLANAYTQSSLSNAASVIGKNVENGDIGENGVTKAYTVTSVESIDGEIYLKARQILYIEAQVKDKEGETINYNAAGEILDAEGKKTGQKVVLQEPGLPVMEDGKPVILDKDNEKVEDHGFELAGKNIPVYSDKLAAIPFTKVTKIF